MSPKSFLAMTAVAAISIGLAGWAIQRRDLPVQTVALDRPLFRDLTQRLNDLGRVRVTVEGKTTTIERDEQGWKVVELDRYPADPQKIREMALALAEIRIVEAKTDKKERLARLELEDPAAEKAKSKLVALEDRAGKEMAAIVTGKSKYGLFGPGREGVYVRLAAESRAWLADRKIGVPEKPMDWIQRQVMDMPRDKVARIELRPGAETAVVLTRPSADAEAMELTGVPEGREVDAEKIDRLAGTLSGLTLQDVKAASKLTLPPHHAVARFTSVDGLVVEARLAKQGEGDDAEYWVILEPGVGEPMTVGAGTDVTPVDRQAAALTAEVGPWAFKLSRYVAERLLWTQDELLKPAGKTS